MERLRRQLRDSLRHLSRRWRQLRDDRRHAKHRLRYIRDDSSPGKCRISLPTFQPKHHDCVIVLTADFLNSKIKFYYNKDCQKLGKNPRFYRFKKRLIKFLRISECLSYKFL